MSVLNNKYCFSVLDLCKPCDPDTRNLIECLDEMISDGETQFDRMCESDQLEIIGFLMPALDKHCKPDFLTESNYFDGMYMSLSDFFKKQNTESLETYLEDLKKQAIDYYAGHIQTTIDEILERKIKSKIKTYDARVSHGIY